MSEEKHVLSFDMGSRNLAYAVVAYPVRVVDMGMIDLGKHAARVATDNLIDLMRGSYAWMLEGNYDVVVELQPGSGVCKTLSHVIQTVFYYAKNVHVRFMPAGRKFKYDPETYVQCSPQTYLERKKCAIMMAERILAATPEYLATFQTHKAKQKSDLADAIVQGALHAIETKKKSYM